MIVKMFWFKYEKMIFFVWWVFISSLIVSILIGGNCREFECIELFLKNRLNFVLDGFWYLE